MATPGKVYVFFGRQPPSAGTTLSLTAADADRTLSSSQPADGFGFAISGGYDLTGDSVPDIAVGAPMRTHNGNAAAGAAYLFDGATGILHTTIIGQSEKSGAGFTVLITAPDVASLESHLLVGAPGDPFAPFDPLKTKGRVAVFTESALSGGDGAFLLSESDRTLMAVEEVALLFGSKLDREYAQPGQPSQGVLIGYGLLVPATSGIVGAFGLDVAISWHVSLAMTSKYASPFTAEEYRFLTENGSGRNLSHPYVPPAIIPDDESLTMKHHGDATKDYQIDFADVQAIHEKLGAAGEDAGDADVDGDGIVTLSDMALALDNQGMTLLQAIRTDCEGMALEGVFLNPCDCMEELLGRPPANFMIDPDMLEGDPCAGGGGPTNPPPPPPPPPPPACDDMSIEEPSDCDDFARCSANEQFQDMIESLQNAINDAQQQVNNLEDALFDAEAARAAAAAERDSWVRAATQQVDRGMQASLSQLDAQSELSVWDAVLVGGGIGGIAGAGVGVVGGPLGVLIGAGSGGLIGIIGGLASHAFTTSPAIAWSTEDVVNANNDARDSIGAAGNGDASGGRPQQTSLGAVVAVATWSSLAQAGAAWDQANQAVRDLQDQLDAAEETLSDLRRDMEAASDAYQDAYDDAHDQCCDTHFEGVPCGPPESL